MYDIENLPNVTYYELDSNPMWNGEGSQIPIFIGTTGTAIDGDIKVQKFKTYSSAFREKQYEGIGKDLEKNPLLRVLKDFFTEAAKTKSDDIGVSYAYVIDLGTADITSTEGKALWTKAFDLAKSKRDVEVEVYVGLTGKGEVVVPVLTSALASIMEDSKDGSPRIAYYTIEGATDQELIDLTDETKGSGKFLQSTRVGLCEPKYFGKTVAKICTTPYYEEPGYTEFRTIEHGEFNVRTPDEEKALQKAGIIFIRDELTRKEIFTRINLAVSTGFAENIETRKNDCLLHARRNVDHLIRELFDVAFTQLKRNETEVNLKHLQTDVDSIVDAEIEAGNMMTGTQCFVEESSKNPYDLVIEGNAVAVNSTLSIGFGMYVSSPNVQVLND